MTALAEIQSAFQAAVLADDPRALAAVAGRGAAPGASVYCHAYRARLAEVLAADYPTVAACMGADAFAELAAGYARAYPSRARSLRWFGASLPAFLVGCAAPWLTDVARFEWALGLAFDAPDGDPVALADLASLAPEAWDGLRFTLDPAVRLLALDWDAPALKASVAGGVAPPPARPDRACWLVWRNARRVRYKRLAPDQAHALAAARGGARFGAICAGVAKRLPLDGCAARTAEIVREWFTLGLVRAVSHSG
jgi:hypothetical protein